MNIEKEREAFERYAFGANYDQLKANYDEYEENYGDRYPPYTYEGQWESWLTAKSHEAKKLEGCVVVPVEHLNKSIDAIEAMFEDDPTLALGELLPIQQEIKAMVEAARGGNE